MPICSCNRPALKDIVILLYPLLIFCISFLNDTPAIVNSFAFYFLQNIAWLFGGLIILFYDLFANCNRKRQSIKPTIYQFDQVEIQPQHKKRKYMYPLLICSVFLNWFVLEGYPFFMTYELEIVNSFSYEFFLIGIITLLTVLLLKRETYRHNYLALAMNGIGLGTIAIPFIISSETLMLSLGITLLQAAVLSVYFVFLKYIMLNKHIRPLMLLFFIGLIGICILLIVYLFVWTFDSGSPLKERILNVFTDLLATFRSWHDFGMVFGLLILVALMNLSTFSIIYFDDAISFANSKIIGFAFDYIQMVCTFDPYESFLTYWVIGVLLIICGNLIYFEVVSLNCFGLEKNTKREIIKRSDVELLDESSTSFQLSLIDN